MTCIRLNSTLFLVHAWCMFENFQTHEWHASLHQWVWACLNPGSQSENNHHHFTKGSLSTFILQWCLGWTHSKPGKSLSRLAKRQSLKGQFRALPAFFVMRPEKVHFGVMNRRKGSMRFHFQPLVCIPPGEYGVESDQTQFLWISPW